MILLYTLTYIIPYIYIIIYMYILWLYYTYYHIIVDVYDKPENRTSLPEKLWDPALFGSQDLLVKVVRAVGPWASSAGRCWESLPCWNDLSSTNHGTMENWGNMFSWGRCLWSFHIETMLSWFPFQGETRIIYPLVNLTYLWKMDHL